MNENPRIMGLNIRLDVFSHLVLFVKVPVMKRAAFLLALGLPVSATANAAGNALSVGMVMARDCPIDHAKAYGIEISRHSATDRTAARGIVRRLEGLGQ